MSAFHGLLSVIRDELSNTVRAFKSHENQLLLLVAVLVALAGLALGWGILKHDSLSRLLNQASCRQLSAGQVMTLMYLSFAFCLLAVLVLGAFFSLVQQREAMHSRPQQYASPLYKEAKRFAALQSFLFIVVALVLGLLMSQWC